MKSLLNRSAVKRYALEVSKAKRAGKFTRVSKQFFLDVEADLESAIRNLAGVAVEDPVPCEENLAAGEAGKKALAQLQVLTARIVQRRVRSTPSCGCTL